MGARRSKRHHSVPQEHLRRFTGEDGLLYQYQRGDGTVRRVSPTNAAVESYLYAPGDGPDPRADDVEAFLSEKIEGPAIPALRKLADGDPELSDEERHRVALYIAFQEQRVPAMRDRILDFAKEIAMDLMRTAPYREDFESMCREIGEDPDEVRRGQKLLEEGGMTLEMSNRLWLRTGVHHAPATSSRPSPRSARGRLPSRTSSSTRARASRARSSSTTRRRSSTSSAPASTLA
jgi:hypothetical protein